MIVCVRIVEKLFAVSCGIGIFLSGFVFGGVSLSEKEIQPATQVTRYGGDDSSVVIFCLVIGGG